MFSQCQPGSTSAPARASWSIEAAQPIPSIRCEALWMITTPKCEQDVQLKMPFFPLKFFYLCAGSSDLCAWSPGNLTRTQHSPFFDWTSRFTEWTLSPFIYIVTNFCVVCCASLTLLRPLHNVNAVRPLILTAFDLHIAADGNARYHGIAFLSCVCWAPPCNWELKRLRSLYTFSQHCRRRRRGILCAFIICVGQSESPSSA